MRTLVESAKGRLTYETVNSYSAFSYCYSFGLVSTLILAIFALCNRNKFIAVF